MTQPRHPAPWRQIEAILYERANDLTLPGVVETAGSKLINAPSTPTRPHDPTFVQDLRQRLELALLEQGLRRRMYGNDLADDIRAGHTPPGLREHMRMDAFAGYESDSSSMSEESSTSVEPGTPLSCDAKHSVGKAHEAGDGAASMRLPASPLALYPKHVSFDGSTGRLSRKRKREDVDDGPDTVKRRR
ncbi:hypothetical protein BKA56DRAFT_681572 [Ilyonectria sp. MPI-CAGE-AT-0026]|nr:hypothetical protein BKA56DRAFT_681572 [Ilyonectria sp. MPI-CAGE-AT-0026]